MPGPTTNGLSAMTKAAGVSKLATAMLLATQDDPPRELAASERAGKAGAVKVDKNNGTLPEEVEKGLPADG